MFACPTKRGHPSGAKRKTGYNGQSPGEGQNLGHENLKFQDY